MTGTFHNFPNFSVLAPSGRTRAEMATECPRSHRSKVMKLWNVPAILLSALLAAIAAPAAAHNLAPAYLELRELGGGAVAVLWKISAVVPRGVRLEPTLPCPAVSEPTARLDGEGIVLEWRLVCAGSLVGREVAVAGIANSGTDTILRVALADGREIRAILSAAAPTLTIPERESARAVFASYFRLGAKHLATGLDHVLFVAGLALLLGATSRLLVAITAFTAGHSVTLALAALGFVNAPRAAVEVAIAATIVALALSLARQRTATAPAGLAGLARRPALLPFAFGLLHGLGFASALGELGLPQHAIPLALFAFNVGIEAGQLALVAALIVSRAMLARARRWTPSARLPAWLVAVARESPATALGSLGVFWCLDRAAGWLFP